MEDLPVLATFHYDRIGSWRCGNPFCIAFCYTSSMYSGTTKFIVKGGSKEVDRYIDSRPFPLVVYRTYWWHGHGRSISTPSLENFREFTITGERPYWCGIQQWRIKSGPYFYKRFELRYLNKVVLSLRRVPRKWMPEYDQIIQTTRS